MKGNSNTQPNRLERTGRKYQVRWNITRNDRAIESGEAVESWDYEYANADACTRDAIISAIIRDRYKLIDDELAIINNKDEKPDEYAAYQDFRAFAKQVAEEVIS